MWIGQLTEPLASVSALCFSPDGHALYTGDDKGCVLAWDIASRSCRELCGRSTFHFGRVSTFWPTPDGSRVLVNSSPSPIDVLHPTDRLSLERGHDYRYLLPDGHRIISCEPEYRVGLWDLRTGEQLPVPGALGEATHITHHQLLPDGVTLLTYCTTDNALALWDFRTGERIGELTPSDHGINPCALARDGITFAVGRKSKLWVYDVPARGPRHKLPFEKDIRKLAFHPNGRLVASASTNSVVTFWDTTAGERVAQFDWKIGKASALCFAPDGLTCAAGGFEKFVVFDVDL
jgi:WD40 repeat protein